MAAGGPVGLRSPRRMPLSAIATSGQEMIGSVADSPQASVVADLQPRTTRDIGGQCRDMLRRRPVGHGQHRQQQAEQAEKRDQAAPDASGVTTFTPVWVHAVGEAVDLGDLSLGGTSAGTARR